jgi:transposase-like protein
MIFPQSYSSSREDGRTEARRCGGAWAMAPWLLLRIPKLPTQSFETATIDRYQRRESSVDDGLIEMYLAGISVRRVEDIT